MDHYDDSSSSSVEDFDQKCTPCFVLVTRLTPDTVEKYTKDDQNVINDGDDDNEEDNNGQCRMYDEDINTVDLTSVRDRKAYLKKLKENRALQHSGCGKLTKGIFSIFTLDDFYDRGAAILSYYDQLKYAPHQCVLCDVATIETSSMVEHYLTAHEDEDVIRFRTLEVAAKEKWVSDFIDYQIAVMNDDREPLPNNIVHKYCPVCQHYDWKNSSQKAKRSDTYRHAVLLDKNHINKHLRYFPFVCTLCRDSKKRYSVTMINEKARDHLKSRHDFKRVIETDLTTYFKAVNLIPELENFLRDYVSIIDENTKPRPSTSCDSQSKENRKKRKTCATPSPKSQLNGKTGKSSKSKTSTPSPKHQPNGKTGKPSKPKASTPCNTKGKNGQKMRQQYEKLKRMRQETRESDEESQKSDEGLNAPANNQLSSDVICIFCELYNFSDIFDVWDHYSNHLNYTPIVCSICKQKFHGISSFQYHGVKHPEISELPYGRITDDSIETWGELFIGELSTGQCKDPSFATFCPICKRLFPQPSFVPSIPFEEIRRHIYFHLKYFPFQCLECGEDEKKFFSDLSSDKIEHLQKVHNINCDSNFDQYFSKSRSVPALDHFIELSLSSLSNDKPQAKNGNNQPSYDSTNSLSPSQILTAQAPNNVTNSLENGISIDPSIIFKDVEQILSCLENGGDLGDLQVPSVVIPAKESTEVNQT